MRHMGYYNSAFRGLHDRSLALGAHTQVYMCGSEGSRASAWRNWKDWEGWSSNPADDGPIHDNKKFITRYGNGSRVEFRVVDE